MLRKSLDPVFYACLMLSTTVYLPTTEAKPLDDETAISDYSKQGNRNNGYARNHYQYNALNQLTQVDHRDSSTPIPIYYAYYPDRFLASQSHQATTHYHYYAGQGSHVNSLQQGYYAGYLLGQAPELYSHQEQLGTKAHIHIVDRHHSVLTEIQHNELTTHHYNAYGMDTLNSGEQSLAITHTPLKYNGYRHDALTHLYYLKARHYSPYLRSFLSRDTYDLTNRYAYVKGNPINYTDPSGHTDIPLGDWGESVAWRNEALLLKTSRMPKMKLPRPAENPITYLREALQVKRQDIPKYVYRIDGRTPREINSNKHLGFRPKEYVNLNPDWKQGPGNPEVETLMRTMIGNRHADGSYHTGANGVSVSYNLNFSAAVPKYSGYLYRIKGKDLPENTFKIEQPADITLYNVGNYNFEMNFVGRARRSNIEYYSTSKNRWQPINNFISRDNPYVLVQRNKRNVMTGVQMANLPYSKTNGIYLFQQWYRRKHPSITWTFH